MELFTFLVASFVWWLAEGLGIPTQVGCRLSSWQLICRNTDIGKLQLPDVLPKFVNFRDTTGLDLASVGCQRLANVERLQLVNASVGCEDADRILKGCGFKEVVNNF